MSLIFKTVRTAALFVVLLFTALLASVSQGRDIFVNGKSGDNRSTGHSVKNDVHATGPVRTIARAIELAEGGDRIILDPQGGPYRESISLVGKQNSGAFDLPFTIEGNGAVLDGREILPTEVWKHVSGEVYRFQVTMKPVDMHHLALYDGDTVLKRIRLQSGSLPVAPALEPNSWCLHEGFVYFRTEGGKSPLFENDYSLSYSARPVGVSLVQVLDVRIHDLNVRGFQLDGVSAANGAVNVVLDNVSCTRNGRSGLAIGGASIVAAGYCTFAGNQAMQVLSQPFSKCRLYDCKVGDDQVGDEGTVPPIVRSDEAELLIEASE